MGMMTAWEILGVGEGAPLDECEHAYRRRMRCHHPDVGGSVAAATALNWAIERVRTRGSTSTAASHRPANCRPVTATPRYDDGRWMRSARPAPHRRKVIPRWFGLLIAICIALVLLATYWQVIILGVGALWAVAVVMGAVTE